MNTNEPELPDLMGQNEPPDNFRAMAMGATMIFIIAFIPFAVFGCCLPQILGSLLAIHLFTSQYSLTLTAGQGIKLGILTCLLGALSSWVVSMGLYFLFDYQIGAREIEWLVLTLVEKTGNQEALEQTKAEFERQKALGLSMPQIIMGLVVTIVFASLSGLIGGAIGAKLFQRSPNNL